MIQFSLLTISQIIFVITYIIYLKKSDTPSYQTARYAFIMLFLTLIASLFKSISAANLLSQFGFILLCISLIQELVTIRENKNDQENN